MMSKSKFTAAAAAIMLLAVIMFASGCSKQAKASRHLKRANAYFTADDYGKAEIEYLNVLRLNPTNAVALRNLGNIYYADELLLRAAAFFNSLKKVDPNDIESRAKLARVYLTGGAVKEAREEAAFVLENSPANEEALLVLIESSMKPEEVKELPGRIAALQTQAGDKSVFHLANGYIALRNKEVKTAEAEFKRAASLDPKSATAQAALGGFYLSQTNLAMAEPALKLSADLSPIRSARRLRIAALKEQEKDINGATEVLKGILSKAPDYTPAWMYTARLALQQTNFDKCSAALQRVINRDPENYDALSLRAEMYVAQNKPAKAVEDLERVVTRHPKSPAARYQLALAALMAKDVPRALSSVHQAVLLDPNFVPAVLLLAELNLRKGETAPAITSLTEFIKRQPKVLRAYMLLATAYQSSGKLDEALAVYNSASAQFPNTPEIMLMTGVVLRQKGSAAEARKTFESIVKSQPDDPAANAQLVEMDIAANNFNPAIQRIQSWIDRAPANPEPIFQMARIRYAQNDFKAAQANLEKVISMNQDAIAAYLLLARTYYATKQLDAAVEKCRLALSRNPKDTSSLLLEAIIYGEKGDFEHSRDDYEKLLAIAPMNIVALNNLAVVYADHLNQLDKAYTLARQANELRPNDPSIADTLGWILVKRGDYSLALAPLRQAAQDKPTDAEVMAHLGIAQYMLDDETGARTTLARALNISSAFNGRDQAEESVKLLSIDPSATDKTGIAALEQRLAEKPADPVALSRLAAIHIKNNQFQEAAGLYEKALATNPKLALASARLADLNDRRLNDPAKALELAKNARKLDTEDTEVARIAGRIASRSDDLKDQQWGLSLLQESSQKRPGDPTIAYDLAWSYFVQGRLNEAADAMKIAAADPTTAAAAKRFLDFTPLIDPDRAAQNLPQIQQTLQQDPNFLPALVARAAAVQQNGDPAEAMKLWDQITARWPGFVPALRNYSIIAAAQKSTDTAKALAVATRAREALPEDLDVAKALGILQYQAGDYNKAVRTLSAVANKRGDDGYVQYYLGMSHYRLKQNPQSKAALQNAVRLQAKAPFIPDAQRALAELK